MNDKAVKILHFSDCHLDTKFVGLDEKSAILRRDELREKFKTLLLRAKDSDCDVVLISGDVFDSESVSMQTVSYLLDCFELVSDIHIFICAGNHDPFDVGSIYSSVKFPDNVHIFSVNGDKVYIEELNLCVYGISMQDDSSAFEPYEFFKVRTYDPERINILLAHAPQLYSDKSEPHFETLDAEYVAFGHIHKFEGIKRYGSVTIAHPGILEARSFKDSGQHGYIEGYIGKGYCDLQFVPYQIREYINDSICITDCRDYSDIYEILDNVVLNEKNLYSITLTGSAYMELNLDILDEYLKDKCFFSRFENCTDKGYNYEIIRNENSLRGLFTDKLLTDIENESDYEQKKLLERALALGMEAIDNI